MNTTRLITAILGLCIGTAAIAQETAEDAGIPPQPLNKALEQFADKSGLQIIYVAELAEGKETPGAKPNLSDTDTLDQLLASTGLQYEFLNDNTVTVQAAADDAGGDSDPGNGRTAGATPRSVMMAQAVEQSQTSQRTETDSDEEEEKRPIEEVVVTGTLIRGEVPIGAPLITLDRETIERSALSTTAQVIQTLPQNLAAGANEATSSILNTGGGAQFNTAQGSTINLRGLGADKTLTLINGRRSAPGGSNGSFIDISMIPLTAVERIEIITDGASALYGSDAVAGVVNFVLRQDYEGAETRVRFGSVTEGNRNEYQISQVLGTSWHGGNAIVAYEYFDQDKLFAADRDFASSSDLTRFGGDNFNQLGFGNPGTIIAGGLTFAIPEGQDGSNLTPSDLIAGTTNSRDLREGNSILPAQKRHSVYAAISQELSEGLRIFGEGRFSHRTFEADTSQPVQNLDVPSTNPFFVDPIGGLSSVRVQYAFLDDSGPSRRSGEVQNNGFSAGAEVSLWTDWQLETYGSFGREETDTRLDNQINAIGLASALADTNPATAFNPFGDGSHSASETIESIRGFITSDTVTDIWAINAKVDGSLFDLPGGSVKLAAGAEYRNESFMSGGLDFRSTSTPVARTSEDFDRNVIAAFGEVNFPIVGEDNRRPGLEKFALSAALRFEDYSDFGTTINPKFGAVWSPIEWLMIRGTYGTSFRAPLLTELDPNEFSIFAFPTSDPASPTGSSVIMLLFGDNPNLQPEEATIWTAGMDFEPSSLPGLRATGTFFDIHLDGRISRAPTSALQRENEFAPAITRNPDPAVAQAFVDDPNFNDFGFGFSGSDIDVILDVRLNNLSVTDIRGIDFGLTYSRDMDEFGSITFGVNSSYIVDFKEAFASTSPIVERVDTVGRQVDFRARGNVSWNYRQFKTSLFANYTDGYSDDVSTPSRRVDSYTTVDLNLSYNTGQALSKHILNNIEFSISAINLFDTDPPFVNNPTGIGFDPVNANPRGRFIALQVRKAW